MKTTRKDFRYCITCIVRGKWQNLTLKAFDRLMHLGKLNYVAGNWVVEQVLTEQCMSSYVAINGNNDAVSDADNDAVSDAIRQHQAIIYTPCQAIVPQAIKIKKYEN